MFAKAGGQYAYLKEAYGELPAFLYAWVTFVVINGSAIAALSLTFAKYFAFILPLGERGTLAVAVPAILGMASVNILQHAHPQAGPGLCRHRVSAAGTAFLFLLPEAVGNGRRPSGSL
jgi:amino acid transporter